MTFLPETFVCNDFQKHNLTIVTIFSDRQRPERGLHQVLVRRDERDLEIRELHGSGHQANPGAEPGQRSEVEPDETGN